MLNLFLVLYGYLSLATLYWGYGRVSSDDVGPRHGTNGVKGVGECSLQCHYVLNLSCGTRGSHLRQLHLGGGAKVVHKDGLNGECDSG